LAEEMKNVSMDNTSCNMTISTTSSCAFNANDPFNAPILKARYLTNTDTTPAKLAAEILSRNEKKDAIEEAMKCFDEGFPLSDKPADAIQNDNNGKRVIELTIGLPCAEDFAENEEVPELEYQPGDAVGLIIPNPASSVNFVLKMLKSAHNVSEEEHFVSIDETHPIDIREAMSKHVDLEIAPVKKRILLALSRHANDPKEAATLELLSSKTSAGESLYKSFCEGYKVSAVDILRMFPSCTPTVNDLFAILPGIVPRYYSVSSSPLTTTHAGVEGTRKSLTVAFSVVDYLTSPLLPSPLPQAHNCSDEDMALLSHRRRKHGLATCYLETICSSLLTASTTKTQPIKVSVFPKPTTEFRLPSSLSTPLILVGPGTGVAPFIGFLSHRQSQFQALQTDPPAAVETVEGTWRGGYELTEGELSVSGKEMEGLDQISDYRKKLGCGSMDLFFGCRRTDHDWIYKNEMETFKKDSILTNLYTAFSRQDPNKKVYVQNLLNDEDGVTGKRMVDLVMNKDAAVYVCGDGNAMGKDVQEALVALLVRFGGMKDLEEGRAYLENMKKNRKFLLDIWS